MSVVTDMQISSHLSMDRSNQNIDRSQGRAQLSLSDIVGGSWKRASADDKYAFEFGGVCVRVAEGLAGPDGVGKGGAYQSVARFLKGALEKQLGADVDGISIAELEVESSTCRIKSRSANPNELLGNTGISYRTSKKDASVEMTHITVTGTVHTCDGREKAFTLTLDTQSETAKSKTMKCYASGDAAKNLPMTLMDGFTRAVSGKFFQFDSDPSSGLLEGKGTNTVRESVNEEYGYGFRRYDWRA